MTKAFLPLLFAFLPATSAAGVFLSTLPAMPLGPAAGWGVVAPCCLNSLATSFTAPGNYSVSQIRLDLFTNPQPPTSIFVEIVSDSNGSPGALAGPRFLMPISNPLSSFAIDAVDVSGISLVSGSAYWLVVLPNTPTYVTWALNGSAPGNLASSVDDGISWIPVGTGFGSAAFELVAATPEPGFFGLLACGLAGLVLLRRQREH